jgi:hypothetical protein
MGRITNRQQSQITTSGRLSRGARIAASLAALVWFAGISAPAGASGPMRADLHTAGPGAVFESVEAAALDALAHAYREATPTDRRRLRAGTIYRVSGGYSYTAAKRSGSSSPLMAPSIRYRLRSIDVARYVIPPRSGSSRADRLNEEPNRKEKQIVDELDPAHRPLYQLTPSRNIVRYHEGGQTTVVTSLDELAAARLVELHRVVRADKTVYVAESVCPIRSEALYVSGLTAR